MNLSFLIQEMTSLLSTPKIIIIVIDHLLITYYVLRASPTFTLDYKFYEVKVMDDLFTALDLQFITVPSTQKKLSK